MAGEAETNTAIATPTLAVLRLENLSSDPKADHWQLSIGWWLERQLAELPSLREVPESSRRYAYGQLQVKPDQVITAELAGKLGKAMEAR